MKKTAALFVFLAFLSSAVYGSTIFLQITKNLQEKAEIVLLMEMPRDVYWNRFLTTLDKDLGYSGYFKVNESVFTGNIEEMKKKYPIEFILSGSKTKDGVKIRVEDPLDEKTLFEKTYPAEESPSYLAHRINDDVVFSLTGRPGIALSKILFVSDDTGKYQLYSVDYDGENKTQLTKAGHLVHYPKWLVPGREIVYVSYEGGWPKLVKMNLKTGSARTLIAEPGLNACASPNPKTGEMAVVLSRTGRPEVYIANFEGRILRQLTFSKATNASPSFSPSGDMLAFVSDRHGSPQIYTMTNEGTKIERISFLSGYATSPAWSPDGNYIAYVFMSGGSYGLALYEPESEETKIVNAGLGSEDISWAPDSRHIVYSDIKSKPSSIMIIDIITGERRKLSIDRANSFSPNWSLY